MGQIWSDLAQSGAKWPNAGKVGRPKWEAQDAGTLLQKNTKVSRNQSELSDTIHISHMIRTKHLGKTLPTNLSSRAGCVALAVAGTCIPGVEDQAEEIPRALTHLQVVVSTMEVTCGGSGHVRWRKSITTR
jgi:hypothetical protein